MKYQVAFETFGCRLNQSETATLHRGFLDQGYGIIDNCLEADLCVINTCALTSQAASKCRRKVRSILKRNPEACVAVVGCYAQTDLEILRAIPGIDYIVGTADKLRLPDIIPSPAKQPEALVVHGRTLRERFTIPGAGYYPFHTRANLKIQEGCNFVCSFCIVPRSRGPARSREFNDIIREARELVLSGHRELILTGVNMGTYQDGSRGLSDLVQALSDISGLERIRLSSIEPTTIEPALIDAMAGGGKLCRYLHVPAQSGDNGILDRMRRHYTAGDFVSFVHSLVDRIPEIGLGTDIMVGFPGESEEAFGRSYRLIEELPFTHIHVFSFSARPRTAAWAYKDKVPSAVITQRSAVMHELASRKKRDYYQKQTGKTVQVLFEEREPGGRFVGFSDNYVKIGVETAEDLSNRTGLVRITGLIEPGGAETILAVGELVETGEAGRDRAGRRSLG
jgi:threonylcarbamoyladenosine tRNA methylthiotransferase MtaB